MTIIDQSYGQTSISSRIEGNLSRSPAPQPEVRKQQPEVIKEEVK